MCMLYCWLTLSVCVYVVLFVNVECVCVTSEYAMSLIKNLLMI